MLVAGEKGRGKKRGSLNFLFSLFVYLFTVSFSLSLSLSVFDAQMLWKEAKAV